MGVARATSVLGPFEKYEKNPILKSNNEFSGNVSTWKNSKNKGPGHCSVFSLENDNSPDHLVMIYHSWTGLLSQ